MKWLFSEGLLAAIPLFALIIMLIVLRWSVLRSAAAALILVLFIAAFYFGFDSSLALGSFLKAMLITLDIAIILLGAIIFFKSMKLAGVMDTLQQKLLLLTPDHRLQAILVAWLLGGFIEGIAGFGTPALVVAPLLVSIGFSALRSVLIALIANSTAVTFGAVGTPIRVGFNGMDIQGVAEAASVMNLFAGPLIPLMMLAVIVTAQKEHRWQSFKEAAPWALWAGLAFTVPMWLFVQIGQEFGSSIGALMGLALAGISIKLKFLIPQNCWQVKPTEHLVKESTKKQVLPFYLPYLILILLLLTGKFLLQNGVWDIALPGSLVYSFKIFNPGWFFIITLLIIGIYRRSMFNATSIAFFESSAKAANSLSAILFIATFVQVFINAEMLNTLAKSFNPSSITFLAPFLGAFGSFLTGSATVSNMLMAPILSTIDSIEISRLLALQLIGAAAGNMIALQNIVTITAAVEFKEKEGSVLLYLIAPCILYLLFIFILMWLLLP